MEVRVEQCEEEWELAESMYFQSSRDEIFELFVRPNGSLSCFKRDSTNQ